MWFNGKLLKLMHKHQKVKMNKITIMGMTATTTIMSNCHIASIKTRYEAPNFWHLLDEIRYFQFFASKFLNYYNKIRVREHAWRLIISMTYYIICGEYPISDVYISAYFIKFIMENVYFRCTLPLGTTLMTLKEINFHHRMSIEHIFEILWQLF